MKIIIQSPTGIDNEIQDIESLRITLENGCPISILSNHAPLIARVSAGQLKYKKSTIKHTIPISDCILIVKNNLIKLLTLNSLLPENIK